MKSPILEAFFHGAGNAYIPNLLRCNGNCGAFMSQNALLASNAGPRNPAHDNQALKKPRTRQGKTKKNFNFFNFALASFEYFVIL